MTTKPGDLSVPALYTSQAWAWGGLSYAHLFASAEAKRVFDTTNLALAATRMVNRTLVPLRHSLRVGGGFECSPRTREDIVTALHEARFDDVAVVTASETARAWGLPDPDRRTQVVLFVASCAAGDATAWESTVAGQ